MPLASVYWHQRFLFECNGVSCVYSVYPVLSQSKWSPISSSRREVLVRWRQKLHRLQWLVLSRIPHQPVSLHPSGRGDLHPGQICKHQFNLHGESYCHQQWQQKPLGHAVTQRVTPHPPILLSNPDIKLLWPSRKLPLRGLSLSTVVSAASRAASACMHVI